MKRILVRVALVALAFLALRGCFGTSWNQRLTLVIETPQGEVSGSSVTKVSFSPRNKIILRDLDSSTLRLRGEAAMVEVLPGRWLFALLPDQERLIYTYVSDRQADGHIGLEEAIPLIRDQTEPIALDPNSKNSLDFAPRFPILVTFDDIAEPESVRLVDPADLDAAFGCPRTEGIFFPWREAGLIWRDWIESETARLSRERAAGRAGIEGPAAAALEENALMADDHHTDRKEEIRHKELRKLFTNDQQSQWNAARLELIRELPETLPSPETLSALAGGPCYALKAVTVQVTDEPVTEGRVESILPWLEAVGRERASLIGKPQTGLVSDQPNPEIFMVSSGEFSTELFK